MNSEGETAFKRRVETSQPVSAGGYDLPEAAQDSIVLNLEKDSELLREFTNESQEHLQNIEQGVLTLEKSPADRDTLHSIFRAFHNFKGGSALLNLLPISRTAHELESLLDLARQDKLRITVPIINLILEGGDTLKQCMDEMNARLSGKKPNGPFFVQTRDLLDRVKAAAKSAIVAASAPSMHSLRALNSIGGPSAASGGGKSSRSSASVIKVDSCKLDTLVELVGEMMLLQSSVQRELSASLSTQSNLTRNLVQLNQTTHALHRWVMSLRRVSIRPMFQKMNRLVRDLSTRQGKEVDLILSGEDLELDRTIVEALSDPLLHMVRNAVDHGMEQPEVRTQAGKPARGTLQIGVSLEDGNVVLRIQDDGSGLKEEKIRKKAVEKGMLRADQFPPRHEVLDLIFTPGFSTADQLTDISGRGVGMDIVKRNILRLRGRIELDSVPGQGSVFRIYVPSSAATSD